MNTTFTDGTTVVTADWLNDVNDTVYDILGDGTNPPTDAAALLANLGGATITDVNDAITASVGVETQAYSANLDEFAAVNPTAAGLALLDDVDAAAQRTTLGLGTIATEAATSYIQTSQIGVDVQGYDADIPTVSASQAEMETGTEPALRSMSPLRVAQAIAAQSSSSLPSQTGNAGKVLKTNGTSVSWDSPINSGTAINTTSGTAHDFTGIPSWAKRVTLLLAGVSTSGSSGLLAQIGSGTVITSGYSGSGSRLSGGATSTLTYTNGVGMPADVASATNSGRFVFEHLGGNLWSVSATVSGSNSQTYIAAGSLALGGALDRIRLTAVNGTDTFDGGSINILYE